MLSEFNQLVINAVYREARPEINEHTMKLIVGFIACLLAGLTNYFASEPLKSISASYYEIGWSRDVFVGCLFAISAFLLSYNGKPPLPEQDINNRLDLLLLSQWFQKLLSKFAASFAIGIAIFPCKCGNHEEIIPNAHGVSALLMFLSLSIFCYIFYKRAKSKSHPDAKKRALIYAFCGTVIIFCILAIGIHNAVSGDEVISNSRITFWGELIALLAFGISWLTASQKLLIKKDRASS
ncbi:MAG: hypothetical protein PVJ68_06310 [Candidatus Thiodiazotropha sp.]|jgi:hypothetical protein